MEKCAPCPVSQSVSQSIGLAYRWKQAECDNQTINIYVVMRDKVDRASQKMGQCGAVQCKLSSPMKTFRFHFLLLRLLVILNVLIAAVKGVGECGKRENKECRSLSDPTPKNPRSLEKSQVKRING